MPTVLASLLAAIAASAVTLYVVTRNTLTVRSVAAGSIVMGAGIATMHYTGMAAMRLPATCHYDARVVTLSVALAIVIAGVALVLAFRLRDDVAGNRRRKVEIAVLMGAAVPIMNHVGMAAVSFTPASSMPDAPGRSAFQRLAWPVSPVSLSSCSRSRL